jgi:hypothetical protein
LEADDSSPESLTEPFATFDGFLPDAEAEALRAHFVGHFANPHDHRPESHQIWNYWHVPNLYTYLRTSPERVIPRPLVDAFHERLSRWARVRLGLGLVTWPNLSVYVDGCVQHLHNDSTNGRFGFVYSLTPDSRRGLGGETIVLREGDLFRDNVRRPGAGPAMHELIEPRFNRLTVFDDRMPHGVRQVEGGMDPLDGRVVLHGHISEDQPRVRGALSAREVWAAAWEAVDRVLADCPGAEADCHGPLTLRVAVAAHGAVSGVSRLVDRVVRASGADARPLVDAMIDGIRALRLPPRDGPSDAILPIMIGGPLPWMIGNRSIAVREQRPVSAPAPAPAPVRAAATRPAAPLPPDDPARRAEAVASVRRRLAAAPGASRIPKERLDAYVVPDFLTADECDRLIGSIDAQEGERPLDPALPLVAQIVARLDALAGLDPECGEPPAAVSVAETGREARFDFFDPDDPDWPDEQARGGQRTWTATLFLDRPEAGGQMLFPNVGLKLTPAPGYLLLWSNLAAGGEPNGFSVHETLPVPAGRHRLLVRRYRERPFEG